MNILLIDNDDTTINFLRLLTKIEPDWNVVGISDFTDDIQKDMFDMVIVDFHQEENNKILKDIIKLNPKQKIIIVSTKDICHRECSFCVSKYRRRLFKPIEPKDLHHTIKNFDSLDCRYNERFDNIKTILPDIMGRFVYYSYNEADDTIIASESSASYFLKEFNEIVNILNVHDIKYSVEDDGHKIVLQ